MSLDEITSKIFGILYEKWFQNHTIGEFSDLLVKKVGADPNRLNQALELLESKNLIERDGSMYRLTVTGVEEYENTLPPSIISKKLDDRKIILETLKDLYEQDTRKKTAYQQLLTKLGITDFGYLSSTVEYLERKGLVELHRVLGQQFWIRLTAAGFRSFQDQTIDMSIAMTGAYKILFRLENHLRSFVESKLRDKYGSYWWDKAISQGIRKKVDQMKADETSMAWTVAIAKSNTEYLLFEHLNGIIMNNWKDVFEPVFKDQHKILLPLREFETLRNAIAHTRTLSVDGMTRLEQYSKDIFNMTKR